MRIHDTRHNWASQGIISSLRLPAVGRLLEHRRLANIAIYVHLDDNALQAAAEKAADQLAKAI